MSCEGKHNNSDFKFCPECGIKLEHDEELVNKLNKLYTEYLEKVKELEVGCNVNTFIIYSKHKNIDFPAKVFFVGDKFYTMKQYVDETGDDKYNYCQYNLYNVNYSCYSNINNIKNDIEQISKQKIVDDKINKINVKVFPNPIGNEIYYARNIFNNIDSLVKSNCNKEAIKQLISEYLDSE